MDTVRDAVKGLFSRKLEGPKVRYGIVGAGWISQAAFSTWCWENIEFKS